MMINTPDKEKSVLEMYCTSKKINVELAITIELYTTTSIGRLYINTKMAVKPDNPMLYINNTNGSLDKEVKLNRMPSLHDSKPPA